ncbi:MAG: pentapeptide repeat-containing protein [Timaviella obliquedivisa GSE-PSE-MK23-08B]|jgi:uncharacterized protein YjbI with pentapeptide repeats|nr:pentapeptide repeat-containing protein [Timaviella obliquedivisa GSE-PSE-MK23-08B]
MKLPQKILNARQTVSSKINKQLLPTLQQFWTWTELEKKKPWDYLELLVVPLFLALATLYISDQSSRSQKNADIARASQEKLAAQLESEKDQKLADQRYRQNALESYLDDMTSLIEKGLLDETKNKQLKTIARARTITALKILDGESNRLVIQFLRTAGLFSKSDNIASLPPVDLYNADLKGADLAGVNLSSLSLGRSSFQDSNLSGANLSFSYMGKVNFNGDRLSVNFNGANLSGAIIRGSDLTDAQLENANLSNANLQGSTLEYSNLRNANLTKANLQGGGSRAMAKDYINGKPPEPARLFGSDLTNADLRGANLSGVDLTQARLSGTNFQGANLEGANIPELTSSWFCRTIMPDGTVANPNCEK